MKPREINPDCIDDDAWWELEALKLAVINPHFFRIYSDATLGTWDGDSGLKSLGFLETIDPARSSWSPFNRARTANFGHLLVAACKRVSK